MVAEFYKNIDSKIVGNEKIQTQRVLQKLDDHYKGCKDRVIIIVNYESDKINAEFDIICIRKDAFLSIDLKGYSGTIRGNSYSIPWTANGQIIPRKKNPLQQGSDNRRHLTKRLSENAPKGSYLNSIKPEYVNSLVCFSKGNYEDQLKPEDSKWFVVTFEDILLDDIVKKTNDEIRLSNEDFDHIIRNLKLTRFKLSELYDENKSEPSDYQIFEYLKEGGPYLFDDLNGINGLSQIKKMKSILTDEEILISEKTRANHVRRIGKPFRLFDKDFYKPFSDQTKEICDLVVNNRIVYFTGLKHSGKTSFLNARLFHDLYDQNHRMVIIKPNEISRYEEIINWSSTHRVL